MRLWLLLLCLLYAPFAHGELDFGIYKLRVRFGERVFHDILVLNSDEMTSKNGYLGTFTVPGVFTVKVRPTLNRGTFQFRLKASENGTPFVMDFESELRGSTELVNGVIRDPKKNKTIGHFRGERLYGKRRDCSDY